MPSIKDAKLNSFIKQALQEDAYFKDITTQSLNYGDLAIVAVIKAKEAGILVGMNVAKQVFKAVDKKIKFNEIKKDGDYFKPGNILARISGSVSSILSCERVVLNFLSRLSGVATLTREFVNKAEPYKAKIMDTRKTTPGLRLLEKYAVRIGGGYNHRYDLSEAILIKDNHIAALKKNNKHFDLGSMVTKIRNKNKDKEIEVEVDNVKDFKQVISCSVDIIMLDNMTTAQIKECVRLRNKLNKNVRLEVSGNVTLENVKSLASLGMDRISIGSLTHSPKAIDMSLEFVV